MTAEFVIGKGKENAILLANRLNRHGIIAGATGTGKTVTLKVMAENLSDAGIPVFLADIKGDLSSMSQEGEVTEKIQERLTELGVQNFETKSYPVQFWDVLGKDGIPVRTTISEMGPVLLSQLLGLNEVQEGVLNIAFKVADQQQLLLIDIKDLRAMLNYIGTQADTLRTTYGNISQQSIGAILRGLLVLEEQGGNLFFGEPAFEIQDLLQTSADGRGMINILSAEQLFLTPKLYSTFLLWFLSELYESMPEVGDLDQPKMVFFFDEAHVLFQNVSAPVLEKIQLIVRLIRSKGISIFFITQNPTDIPDSIGSQLGNRIQHGLRAFTPKEQKTVNAVSETFRQDGSFDVKEAIINLKVGQAVVSFQTEDGSPSVADVVTIYPPKSSMAAVDPLTRQQLVNASTFYAKYADAVDRTSAHEQLAQIELEMTQQKEAEAAQAEAAKQEAAAEKEAEKQRLAEEKEAERQRIAEEKASAKEAERQARQAEKEANRTTTRRTDSVADRFTKNLMSTVGREVGRVVTRGILGMFKK